MKAQNERNELKTQIAHSASKQAGMWNRAQSNVAFAVAEMMQLQRKDPREAATPKERAQLWWRRAMNKIKEQNKDRKKAALGSVKMMGGNDLDEIDDSDTEQAPQITVVEEDNEADLLNPRSTRGSMVKKKPNNLEKRFKKAFTVKYMEFITEIMMNKFQRKSQVNRSKLAGSTMSILDNRKMSQIRYSGTLSAEEGALIYYLANLILLEQHNLAQSLIEKHYVKMKKCSEVFRGNVKRFQALSTFRLLTINIEESKLQSTRRGSSTHRLKNSMLDLEVEAEKTERYLSRALRLFQRVDCAWGLGLTYFQTASLLLAKNELENQVSPEKSPTVTRQSLISLNTNRRTT